MDLSRGQVDIEGGYNPRKIGLCLSSSYQQKARWINRRFTKHLFSSFKPSTNDNIHIIFVLHDDNIIILILLRRLDDGGGLR